MRGCFVLMVRVPEEPFGDEVLVVVGDVVPFVDVVEDEDTIGIVR